MKRALAISVLIVGCSSDPGFVGEVPTNPDALLPWLQDERYADWEREPAVHPTAGPHGADVRVYVNLPLAASLEAGNAVHPEASSAVKEIYAEGLVVGWAAMVKTSDADGGDSWYWYEVLDRTEPQNEFEGQGLGLCVGCHSAGQDHVRTAWPAN